MNENEHNDRCADTLINMGKGHGLEKLFNFTADEYKSNPTDDNRLRVLEMIAALAADQVKG
jgi:arsenate reductase-like glutaredoxin family protein